MYLNIRKYFDSCQRLILEGKNLHSVSFTETRLRDSLYIKRSRLNARGSPNLKSNTYGLNDNPQITHKKTDPQNNNIISSTSLPVSVPGQFRVSRST